MFAAVFACASFVLCCVLFLNGWLPFAGVCFHVFFLLCDVVIFCVGYIQSFYGFFLFCFCSLVPSLSYRFGFAAS